MTRTGAGAFSSVARSVTCVLGLVTGLGFASVRDGACADSAGAAAPVSGDVVYRAQCAMCHGAGGRGDGPAAAMLLPKPRDLSSPDFWAGRTLESVADVVREGKPGTAMMGYQSVLTPEEITEVVAYLRTLGTR